MAGRGPAPKDPEKRQRRNGAKDLAVVSEAAASVPEVPSPPAGVLKRTRERWAEYWSSPVAKLADPVSALPALERLFALYDDLERSNAAGKKHGHMATGPEGQADRRGGAEGKGVAVRGDHVCPRRIKKKKK